MQIAPPQNNDYPDRSDYIDGMEGDAAFEKARRKRQEEARDSITGAQKSALSLTSY